ncbi:hypothetical protein SAMN05428961_11342 [Paenibacillus sp. OK060]|nr:hypothetical protein SAMN05428961_11342 [Paenibacillus sp. OK060]
MINCLSTTNVQGGEGRVTRTLSDFHLDVHLNNECIWTFNQ